MGARWRTTVNENVHRAHAERTQRWMVAVALRIVNDYVAVNESSSAAPVGNLWRLM